MTEDTDESTREEEGENTRENVAQRDLLVFFILLLRCVFVIGNRLILIVRLFVVFALHVSVAIMFVVNMHAVRGLSVNAGNSKENLP